MRAALCVLALALLAPVPAMAQDADLEYRVKTAFLFNFARFVTWPSGKFAAADSPIELCILASDSFGKVLVDIAKNKAVNKRPVRISRVFHAEDLLRCHIAYLDNATAAGANLPLLAGHQVLTVYEHDSARTDGVIRLFVKDQRVRFEINLAAAGRENLQISSKLLSLASVVNQ